MTNYNKYEELKSKILEGYSYHISVPKSEDIRSVNIITGSGGAIIIINEFQKQDLSFDLVKEYIIVNINDNGYILDDLKVKEK